MVTTTQHWNHGEWTDKQWCISIGLKINPIWKITWQLVGTHSTTKFSLGTVIFQIFEFVQTSWRILLYDTLTIQLTKWPFTVTTRLHQIEHCVFRSEIKFNLSTFLLKYSGNSTQFFYRTLYQFECFCESISDIILSNLLTEDLSRDFEKCCFCYECNFIKVYGISTQGTYTPYIMKHIICSISYYMNCMIWNHNKFKIVTKN